MPLATNLAALARTVRTVRAASFPTRAARAAVVVATLSLAACASTVPGADFTRPLPPGLVVASGDTATVHVAAADGVTLAPYEQTRVQGKIQAAVDARKAANPGGGRSYDLEVTLTEYDKGNAFARAMLAGLGQIHVAGTVRMLDAGAADPVCEFTLSKTFAWGGAYGGSTTIDTIEDTFAQGVAAAVAEDHSAAAPAGTE